MVFLRVIRLAFYLLLMCGICKAFASETNNPCAGYNADTGIVYLVSENLTIDIEYGQHLKGNLGGVKRYVGTGFAFLF